MNDSEAASSSTASARDPYSRDASKVRTPPTGWMPTFRYLGPGMILAGSIVGSGELIVTTKLGAEAGFTFLWFVLLSCLLKVVVQTELARYTISSGRTFLDVFNDLPGPAGQRPHWLTLRWMAIVVAACVIAVAVFVNLTPARQTVNTALLLAGAVLAAAAGGAVWEQRRTSKPRDAIGAFPARPRVNWFTWLWLASMLLVFVNSGAILGGAGQTLQMVMPDLFGAGGARVWAVLVAVLAAALLLGGKYGSLERILVILVSSFTLLTVVCTLLLQRTSMAITVADLQEGLTLHLPDPLTSAVTLTALAMYAGTGVAFGEMWNYTYWCVEKGYARYAGEGHAGEGHADPQWEQRARGWVRVMYIDALLTMVVYTLSTICFYFLGAAILHQQGLNPDGRETLQVLSNIFTESLGEWAAMVFIVGAFCVLFSTVLSGVAGNSRLLADALTVLGLFESSDFAQRLKLIRVFIVASLALFAIAFWLFENPPAMLLVTSSLIAALMYPILGLGVLYLRHCRLDPRIAPGRVTTGWLWICALCLAVISPAGILVALYLGRAH